MDGSFIVVPKDTSSTTHEQTNAAATTTTTTTTTTMAATATVSTATTTTARAVTASLLQTELQALVSPNKVFQNWAQTFRCVPEQYYTPSTEEEVVKVGQAKMT